MMTMQHFPDLLIARFVTEDMYHTGKEIGKGWYIEFARNEYSYLKQPEKRQK